ncbi:MAG: hypothetical protein M1368_05825 [Thaumarchaeota archaeon]|nr:hypothetical protein [Nitrososphaerota archaeon]
MISGQISGRDLLDVSFPNFVPVHIIEIGALIVLICVILGVIFRIMSWHNTSIPKNLVKRIREVVTFPSIVTILTTSFKEDAVIVKPLFVKSKSRWLTHATIMWGFVGLALTTTLAYIFNPRGEPMPFTWPVRILGNVSGVMMIIGCTIFAYRLTTNPSERNPLTFRADIIFFSALFLTVITGFATEFTGYGHYQPTAYIVYAVHLVLVTLLLGSAPFTRFLHALLTPYFAMLERLRLKAASLSKEGLDSKFKERRIAEFVTENFYNQQPDEDKEEDRVD